MQLMIFSSDINLKHNSKKKQTGLPIKYMKEPI